MQHIPYTYVKNFSDSFDTMTEQAKVKLRAALMGVDMSDPEAAREQIADIMERIVGSSDIMAASMAAGFYDGIREFQTGQKLGAIADSGRDPGSTKNATYGITHRLVEAEEPDIALVEGLLVQRLGYEIQRSAGRTMYRNGQRDPNKPKFARIPLGGDSCEFCRMLASQGFVYNSERTAGKLDPDHYHDGCRCRVVCSWEKDPAIDGMDVDEYNDRAWDEYGGDAKSYMSKDHSQHEKNRTEKRRNRYTDDGKLRAGYSGLRVDKQEVYAAEDRKRTAVRAAAQRGNTQRGSKRIGSVSGVSASVDADVKAWARIYPKEELWVQQTNGESFYREGTPTGVSTSKEENQMFRNGKAKHTHTTPVGGTFGEDDVWFTAKTWLQEHEVEDTHYGATYQLVRRPDATEKSVEEFAKRFSAYSHSEYNGILGELYDANGGDAGHGYGPTVEEKVEAEQRLKPLQHRWLQENAQVFGYDYRQKT